MKKFMFAMIVSCLFASTVYGQERVTPNVRLIPSNGKPVEMMELFTTSGTTVLVPQVLTPNLTPGEPFHVQGTHDGTNTASYSLILDGTSVETKPVTARVAGVIDFFRPAGTTAGNHTAVIRANGTGVPPLTTDSATLTFTVAVSTVAVPNVVGMTQAAATSAITGLKFVVGTVTTQASGTIPSGTVISQTPLAGVQATAGSAVNLVVSSGPVAAPPPFTNIQIIR